MPLRDMVKGIYDLNGQLNRMTQNLSLSFCSGRTGSSERGSNMPRVSSKGEMTFQCSLTLGVEPGETLGFSGS